jgi:hypothetical protein
MGANGCQFGKYLYDSPVSETRMVSVDFHEEIPA